MWSISAPAVSAALISSPRDKKFAESIEGAILIIPAPETIILRLYNKMNSE